MVYQTATPEPNASAMHAIASNLRLMVGSYLWKGKK